jgi:RHS repeat-associated protein
LPTVSTWAGTVAGSVSRAYNNNFWVTSESINGGNSVAFTHNKDGLITKAGLLAVRHNAKNGLLTGTTLATVKDAFVYSTFAEPTSYTAKLGTVVLYKGAYTRDALGRITTLKDTIGGTTTTYVYTFDHAGRLTAVKKGTATVASYTYDSNSNRLTATTPAGTVSGTYDAQDRLLTYGNASYTYTANGELATKTVGAQTTTYQYDTLGNLIAATLPNGRAINYIVDSENNRVAKKVNGVVVTGFLYDHGRVVAQLDVNNQIVSQFIYGSGSTSPDYMVAGGVNYRIFSDHHGSPRLVVNSATGQIVEQIDYDEFGNVTNDTNPGLQPFGFAGGLYDQDTKLVRFGARDYDATPGRWTAKDPIRFAGGDTNLYGYVLSDPVNLSDPSGLDLNEFLNDSKEAFSRERIERNLERAKESFNKKVNEMKDKFNEFKKKVCPWCGQPKQEGNGVTAEDLKEAQSPYKATKTVEKAAQALGSEGAGTAVGTAGVAIVAGEEGAKGASAELHAKQDYNRRMKESEECERH